MKDIMVELNCKKVKEFLGQYGIIFDGTIIGANGSYPGSAVKIDDVEIWWDTFNKKPLECKIKLNDGSLRKVYLTTFIDETHFVVKEAKLPNGKRFRYTLNNDQVLQKELDLSSDWQNKLAFEIQDYVDIQNAKFDAREEASETTSNIIGSQIAELDVQIQALLKKKMNLENKLMKQREKVYALQNERVDFSQNTSILRKIENEKNDLQADKSIFELDEEACENFVYNERDLEGMYIEEGELNGTLYAYEPIKTGKLEVKEMSLFN